MRSPHVTLRLLVLPAIALCLVPSSVTSAAEGPSALTLQVNTCPGEAVISVEGRPRGRTPRRLTGLDGGTHWITLSKVGYQDRTVLVDGAGEPEVDLTVPLVPANVHAQTKGRDTGLLIAVCPEDAAIFVDDVWRGNGAAFVPDLAAGAHDVVFTRSGYEVTRRLAAAVDGKLTRVDEVLVPGLDMPPATGTGAQLAVDTCPAGAAVVVDGSQRGDSPIVVDVEPGQHEVIVALPGHGGRHEIVAVPTGSRRELRLPLHAAPPPVIGEAKAAISIASCPANAEVRVTGFRKGRTPVIIKAYAGPVKVDVRVPAGGASAASTRLVTVKRGELAIAEFDFPASAREAK